MDDENSSTESHELKKFDPTDEKQDASAHEQSPLLALNFDGKAKLQDERKLQKELLEFIPLLNDQTAAISDEIKQEIKNALPPNVELTVDIQFGSGSITFAGIIAILDVLGKVNAGINFSKFLKDVVQFAVSKIVRKHIGKKFAVKKITTNVHKKRIDPVHPLTRFFWWCSGSATQILRESPTESAKYVGIGGAVLTTGVLACFSGGYALYTMFEAHPAPTALIFGLSFGPIWGLIIFNLDRYIVSTLKNVDSRDSFKAFIKELLPAIPRFILAILLGITIAKPLELTFFSPEINARIQVDNDRLMEEKKSSLNKFYHERLQDLNGEIASLRNEIAVGGERVRYLQDEYTKEMDGTGGSRRYGYNSVAIRKETEFKQAEADFKDGKSKTEKEIARYQDAVSGIQSRINQDLDEFGKNVGKGFLARIRALSYLTENEDPIRRANYAIIILLIFIELTPVLVKLLSPYGPYDAKLNLKNEAEVKEAKFKKDSMVQISEHHYKSITNAEKNVEDVFHNISINERGGKIRQAWQQWTLTSIDGKGLTAEEFLELSKERFFINRKP